MTANISHLKSLFGMRGTLAPLESCGELQLGRLKLGIPPCCRKVVLVEQRKEKKKKKWGKGSAGAAQAHL